MTLTLVQSSISLPDVLLIRDSGVLGGSTPPKLWQPPRFADQPLSFCSHICEGYPRTYGDESWPGIVFDTDEPIAYACPTDTFNLMRSGRWLPKHEQFIFPTVEEMLARYPTSVAFAAAFRAYFRSLAPHAASMYPGMTPDLADVYYRLDYCLQEEWDSGCNEVTLRRPLPILRPRAYGTLQEREELLAPFLRPRE